MGIVSFKRFPIKFCASLAAFARLQSERRLSAPDEDAATGPMSWMMLRAVWMTCLQLASAPTPSQYRWASLYRLELLFGKPLYAYKDIDK